MRTLLVTALSLLVVTAGWGAETRAFASYWTEFKAAVAKGDKEKVASMTKFPFVGFRDDRHAVAR